MSDEKQSQAEFFADKFMDLGNLAATASVFAQFVEDQIRWKGLWLGASSFVSCVVLSYFLRRKEKTKL